MMTYYCCNYYHDFYKLYFKEYISRRDDGVEYLFGMPVFKQEWQSETLEYVKSLISHKHELHGIAPDHINLGIWSDEKLEGYEVLK